MAGKIKTPEQKEAEGIKRRQSEIVSKLLEKVEKELDTNVKASLGEYIRLVQLQKELEEEEVREIKVTWVEPEEGAEEKTVRGRRPEFGS
jgi:hypothetical protein